MKKYEKPTILVEEINIEDIIAVSSGGGTDVGVGGNAGDIFDELFH